MKSESTGLRAGSRRHSRADGAAPSESGFTLLEALIALTIVAISLTSLFAANTQSLRNTAAASSYAKARIIGQALIASSLSRPAGGPKTTTGSSGPFKWSLRIEPAPEPWAEIRSDKDWRLFRVQALVTWENGRSFQLDALKLRGAK